MKPFDLSTHWMPDLRLFSASTSFLCSREYRSGKRVMTSRYWVDTTESLSADWVDMWMCSAAKALHTAPRGKSVDSSEPRRSFAMASSTCFDQCWQETRPLLISSWGVCA